MKIKLLLFSFLFSVASLSTQAQDLGSLMTTLGDGIKSEAFKGSFNKNKDEWMKKASSLSIDDIKGATSSLSTLAKGLKGSSWLSHAAKADVLSGLMKGGGDASSLVNSISGLLNGLDPS